MVLLAQLDPAEVGDSPQGDVEGLGHAHLEAVKVHLELGRDGVSCGPGPLPPTPGQASSTSHSWDPESGVGEGSEKLPGDSCAAGTGLGPDWRAWGRRGPHLPPCLPAGGPGDPHSLALSLLGVQARGAGLQALQALCGERARGLSDRAGPCEGSEQGLPACPQVVMGRRGALSPPRPRSDPSQSPCSVREALTRRSREQLPGEEHFMAVESARAPRTDLGMGAGGCRQKLLKIFSVGERGRLSARVAGSLQVARWGGALGLHRMGGVLPTCPSAVRAPGPGRVVGPGPTCTMCRADCWAQERGPHLAGKGAEVAPPGMPAGPMGSKDEQQHRSAGGAWA